MIDISFEVFPPKTDDGIAALATTAEQLARVDPLFVSVTYGAGGSNRSRSFDAVAAVAKSGVDIAAHVTCVGQPKGEVDEVLESYAKLGVNHLVALRGDPPTGIDAPYEAHPEGYQFTADLVATASSRFDVSVSAYPEVHPQSPDFAHDMEILKGKIDAGATRAITQMCFDMDALEAFVDGVRSHNVGIPIVPGVFPVHSLPGVSRFASRCGASMPGAVADRFAGWEDDAEASREIAAELAVEHIHRIEAMGLDHVHLYTLNKAPLVLDVCERLARPIR